MPTQALTITLHLLLFRAGPQDFPFDERLMRLIVPAAVAINTLLFALALPPLAALLMGAALVAGTAAATRAILRARGFANRVPQTLGALLATTAVLTLALLPFFAQVAPQLLLVAQHPETYADGKTPLPLPAGPLLAMNVLNFWSFMVSAHIFRHATGVGLFGGGAFAILCTLGSMAAVFAMVVVVGAFA